MAEKTPDRLDEGVLFWGFWLGAFVGAVVTLLRSSRRGLLLGWSPDWGRVRDRGKALQQRLEPVDPVAQSIAEGKQAAQRRRAALGVGGDPR